MLADLGLQTEEQILKHKQGLSLDKRCGCVASRICEECKHLITDSICLCVGYFICPNCNFENGKEIKEYMKIKDKQEVKINKLQLIVAGQNIELTLEQARELKGVLDELFKVEKEYLPSPFQVPIYPQYPNYPIWVESPSPTTRPFWKDWETICQVDGTLQCRLNSDVC